jgi:hypothetical protein
LDRGRVWGRGIKGGGLEGLGAEGGQGVRRAQKVWVLQGRAWGLRVSRGRDGAESC